LSAIRSVRFSRQPRLLHLRAPARDFVAVRAGTACVQPAHGLNKEPHMDIHAIALIVDEPIAGHFYWVLQKQEGCDCRPIDAAPGPMPSYGAAMMAGIEALQRRTEARDDAGPPTIH
jgi:hypothetical protein